MNQYLENLAKNYVVLYIISLIDDSYRCVGSIPAIEELSQRFKNAQSLMNAAVEQRVYPEFQSKMNHFVNLSDVKERLQERDSISCEYIGRHIGWCNAQFMPASRDENGMINEVFFAVSHIQKSRLETQIYKQALKSNAEKIYYFDLTEGIVGKDKEFRKEPTLAESHITLPMQFDTFVEQYFTFIGWKPIKGYEKIFTVNEMIKQYEKGVTRFQAEYFAEKMNRYYRSEFYLARNEQDNHVIVMVVRSDITEEYQDELKKQNALIESQKMENFTHSVLMAFAEPYLNVYVVDFTKDTVTIVKQNGYIPQNQTWLNENQVIYGPSIEAYIQTRVAEEDRAFMRMQMRRENIEKNLADKTDYSFAFHVIEDKIQHDFECRIIRTEAESVYVFGFTNIDALMIEEKRQKELYLHAMEGLRKSQIYLDAISGSYHYMVIYNLTRDTYTMPVKHDVLGWNSPESGRYSDLLKVLIDSFPKADQKVNAERRSIAKQLERYQNGEYHWEDRHQVYDPAGKLHWIQERIMYTTDPESGDVLGISLSSLINEIVQREERNNQITAALSKDYTNVYLFNPRKNQISPVYLRGYAVEGLDRTTGSVSPYWELVKSYAKARVYEEDHDRFYATLTPEAIEKSLEGKEEYIFTYRIVDEGIIRDYQAKIIRTETDGVYIFGFKNIDALLREERKRQKLYQEALAEAERANRAKTDFLSRMSHDIRTPINGIVGMTYMMEKAISDPKMVKDCLQNIKMLTHQLELLINDVLEMSRIESGKIVLSRKTFDLPGRMAEIRPAVAVMADNLDVILAGAHYDMVHRSVVGSPMHIQRILSNIITNAIKYNHPGGSVECWMTEHPVDHIHSIYEFKIQDTGIGMSEEFLKRIFEPFSREKESPTTDYSGTGLGMAITKELVDMMGGSIEIESEPNVGTTVTVYLPLELGKEVENIKADDSAVSMEGKRVLLVEDNKMNLKMARFLLEEENVIVDTAIDGQMAVDVFKCSAVGHYDLILMDIIMPVLDGMEATRLIRSMDRADAKNIPIIAMSANAFAEDVEKCLKSGMNEHIAKPLDIESMKVKIARYL